MRHLNRIFSLIVLLSGFMWLAGCGAAPKTQADFLSAEVEEQRALVADMQALADTLAVNRVMRADSFAYFREIYAMSDDEMAAASVDYKDDTNILVKLGGALKSLWPF